MEPDPEIVEIGDAARVRSPVSGAEGAFVVVELWAGEEPGGVLRRVAVLVLGDTVELRPARGAPRTVLVRRARVLTRGVPRLTPLGGQLDLAPELVALLAHTRVRGEGALAVGDRVFQRGDRFRATAATTSSPLVLEELVRGGPDEARHER